MIKQICDNLPQRSKNGISVPSNPEDKGSLMLLLATLNNCINAATGLNVLFNGIRIIYSFDRASRTQLKNVNSGDNLPLAILHMGKARDLSITPLRFNPAIEVTEVCDVCLGNYSTVILPPESNKHLHCYFSPESTAKSLSDQQVLLIPFIEDMAVDNVAMNPVPEAQVSAIPNLSQVGEIAPSSPSLQLTEGIQSGAYMIATPSKQPAAAESLVAPNSEPKDTEENKGHQSNKIEDEAAARNNTEKSAVILNKATPEQGTIEENYDHSTVTPVA